MAALDTLAVFDALACRPNSGAGPSLDVRNSHVVLAFSDAADQATDFAGYFQASYTGRDLEVAIVWAPESAAAGAVRWRAALERHSIADEAHGTLNLDSDDFGAPVEVTSPAGASGDLVRAEMTLPASGAFSPQAGEPFRLRLARVASDTADTMTGAA
ncbi:MAG: hypothetical protein KDA37_02425 [Planctomycetales bacterium]|nr:hypothetical protein [Planctomycetales bacterium]